MDTETRKRIDEIFNAALDADPADRARLIEQLCAGDETIRSHVESLIRATDDTSQFLSDSPATPLLRPGGRRDEGDRVGPYRLIERIGAGGMGEVWLADRDDEEFSMRAAIKFVRRDFDSSMIEDRFRSERQVLAGLAHPNIARLLDGGATDDGAPFLVMEHVLGEPVDDYCDKHQLSIRQRLSLMRKVCAAVQHAHANLVVHRDLKPGNILVAEDGEPKLLDFGIAKVLGDQDTSPNVAVTQTGQRLLTPRYASPEQIRAEPVTTATDIYSLGVILYELVAGASPYKKAGSDRELESEICDRDPQRPSTALTQGKTTSLAGDADTAELARQRSTDPHRLRKTLRGEIDSIVLMALRKEADRRYATAGELADDLSRYLEGQPVRARPDTFSYRATKFVRRNRAAVAASCIILVLLIGGVIGTSIGLVRALEAEARATREAEEAQRQAAIAQAVNDFLNEDLLASVAPSAEAGRGRDVLMREVLDAAASRIAEGGRFDDEPLVEATIQTTLGTTYDNLGLYDKGHEHLSRAMEIRESELPDTDAQRIQSQINLGINLASRGDLDSAMEALQDAFDSSRSLPDEYRRTRQNASLGLAEITRLQGRFEEAETLLRAFLDELSSETAEQAIFRLQAMNNLAILLEQQSRFDESEPLLREILAEKTSLIGEDDPSTIISMNNVAVNRLGVGAFDEATALLEDVIERITRIQGEDHPGLVTAMHNLAIAYASLGRLEEAESMYRDALALSRLQQGEEHPETLSVMHNLGTMLMQIGGESEAEEMLLATLDAKRRILGEDSPSTVQTINILGRIYIRQQRFDEAEPLILESIDWARTNLGPAHNDTLAYMNSLASMYTAQSRFEDALPVYVETVEILKREMPAGFIGTGVTLAGMGRSLCELQQWDEAEPVLIEAHAILAPLFGESHARVQAIVRQLVALYEATGSEEDAVEWRSLLPSENTDQQ